MDAELVERAARAGYEIAIRRSVRLVEAELHGWERQDEALKEDWREIARAILELVASAPDDRATP